jgi:hypothetical protein
LLLPGRTYISMKTIILAKLLLFSPLYFFAQSLTGLWTGIMTHDSSTIRKEQSYELALTEYRGKVYGYSRSEFIVNDTLYYIVKRVKGTISGDSCEVVDDEIISYNFRGKLDKGVKVVNTFRLNRQDSAWQLDGRWKTNQTKKYYSITGNAELSEEKDLSASKIFPHLEELKKADDVAFYKEQKKQNEKTKQQNIALHKKVSLTETAVAKKQTEQPVSKPQPENTVITAEEDKKTTRLVADNKRQENMKKEPEPVKAPAIQPSYSKAPDVNEIIAAAKKEETRIETQKEEPVVVQQKEQVVTRESVSVPVAKNSSLTPSAEIQQPNVLMNNPATAIKTGGAAALADKRASVFSNTITFKSDSLVLALYDNGEIDGDVVSVLLNGEVIIAKQELKASAYRKTIYITPEMKGTLELVLYAENLGKYPPNTGLLIIHDGDTQYQLRFSADLQTNAAVVLKREK